MYVQRKYGFTFLIAVTILVILGLGVSVASAGNLTNDDILKMDYLHHFTLTPDGTTIVYLITEGDDLIPPDDNGTLMMIDTGTGKETILSSPDESVTVWSVSPDSSRVVYGALPRSGGDKYLAIMDLSSLRKEKKTGISDEILNGFTFAGPDKIVFTGASPDTPKDTRPGTVTIVDAIPDPVILKSYDITTGTVTNLTRNSDVIYAYLPSPDGRFIAYKASEYPESWLTSPTFRYNILDLENETEDEFMSLVEGYQDENEFAWAPDSSLLYIERMQNGGMHYPVRYTSDIVTYTPGTKVLEEIPLKWNRKLLKDLFNDDVEMTPFTGGVYALLADGTNPKLAKYIRNETGWEMTMLSGEHQGNIFAFETTADGNTVYYNYNTPSVPPQIFRAEVQGDIISSPAQLTRLNLDLLKKPLGTSEVVEWKGAGNDTIQGVLRYPPGYSAGTPYPLVVVIHGGPIYTDFDSWRDTWEFPYHLITDTGVITLSTNYHGSTNFGFDFAASIENGHTYDLAVEDLMKGVASLSEKGIIDADRVGVTGWSYGGILTLSWATRDPSLKAGVVGAGSQDENSQDAYTNGIVMNKMYHDKTPFEDPASYIPIMGVYHADKVETPLLMLQGTRDNSVVPASAMSTYRAYKEASKADVQMILFKDEPHHMKHYPNQVRKITEELDWLTKGLFSS